MSYSYNTRFNKNKNTRVYEYVYNTHNNSVTKAKAQQHYYNLRVVPRSPRIDYTEFYDKYEHAIRRSPRLASLVKQEYSGM